MHDEEETLPSRVERKHIIKRYRRRWAQHWYWCCEIWKPGAKKASATVMKLATVATLGEATTEAERLIKVMIRNGGRIPPSESGSDITFDERDGLDGLNAKSDTGKRQWCEKHWATVRRLTEAGTHNAIFAGMFLVSRFADKVKGSGMIIGAPDSAQERYTLQMLQDSYSPLCCWLGDAEVAAIIEASEIGALKANPEIAKMESLIMKAMQKPAE
jgi:hypothetical protein